MSNQSVEITGGLRNFKLHRFLVLIGVIVATLVIGSGLIGASRDRRVTIIQGIQQAINPEPVVVDVHVVTPGPNMDIWSGSPMLGTMPGQSYLGRVVVEVWDEGERMFHTSDANGNPPHPAFFQRAIAALQSSSLAVRTDTPWSDEPATGPLPGQTYHGRVVVEVWDNHEVVAVTGLVSTSDLTQRAARALLKG
jgi:hypothetical protein